jgi:hypothetical protein
MFTEWPSPASETSAAASSWKRRSRLSSGKAFRLWFEALDDQRRTYLVAILERRMRSNLIFALKQLGRAKDAGDLAYSIMNLYDGFWALASVEASVQRETVLELIAGYIEDIVPTFDKSAVDYLEKNSF